MSYCMDCGAPEGKAHGSNCATHERDWPEARADAIGQNGNDGDHYPKQARYQDRQGEDWIDEFSRIATADEFRAAMRFTIGKYLRRIGKKDRREVELRKVEDYARRWREFEQSLEVLD